MVVNVPATPTQLLNLSQYREVYFQVLSGVNVLIAADQSTLATPVSGVQGGLQLSQAQGVVRLPWTGTLWIMATDPNGGLANVEVV